MPQTAGVCVPAATAVATPSASISATRGLFRRPLSAPGVNSPAKPWNTVV